ncbi:histidine kinase [Paenibacillus sp. LHD-117]|uniref:cache domain-containing sensor histidine kinase n=1 Tax=Paenibacillus sp. LHD-117 TaxID=3071412 RepID=UPI0027E16AE6|nr:histidine kinase [Paenibacillus sp. LHD-117]MDQ6417927.1 histidine kinase [Paenibacillus sp. LHD-117]
MFKKAFQTLQYDKLIFGAILIIVIPLLLTQFLIQNRINENYRADLVKMNNQFAHEFQTELDNILTEMVGYSLNLYTNKLFIEVLESVPDYNDYLYIKNELDLNNSLRQLLPTIPTRGIYLYSNYGLVYSYNYNTGALNADEVLPDGPWLKSVWPDGIEYQFLGLHAPKQLMDGVPVISLVRKVTNPTSRESIGLLIVDIEPSMITNSFFKNRVETNNTILVLDGNKKPVLSTNPNLTTGLLNNIALQSGGAKDSYTVDFHEQTYLISSSISNVTGWQVLSIAPHNSVVKNADWARNLFIIVTLTSLVCAILLSYIFSKMIIRPILTLNVLMKRVGMGDFSVSIDNRGMTREINSLIFGFNAMLQKIRDLLKNEIQINIIKKEAEFKALQAQINPHFLYNTLENIIAMAEIAKAPQEIAQTCRSLSNMFRYNVDVSNYSVHLEYEIEHVRDYLSIQNLRLDQPIELQLNIEEEIKSCIMPKFMLQPIVENCVHHAFYGAEISTKPIIRIEIIRTGEDIRISIADNGCGLHKDRVYQLIANIANTNSTFITGTNQEKIEKSSIGLSNIHSRCVLLYGDEYGIKTIESEVNNGTNISLSLPIKFI